jgi:hypothetical protein
MASEEALLNIYTCFVDQNYGESGENMCRKCYKMKYHLELLMNELKSSQLIIKIHQEEIKSTSTCPKNQDSLTNGVVRSINPMMNLILPAIRTVHGRKFDAPQRLCSTRGPTTQIKGLQTHFHYHRIVITL